LNEGASDDANPNTRYELSCSQSIESIVKNDTICNSILQNQFPKAKICLFNQQILQNKKAFDLLSFKIQNWFPENYFVI